MRNITLWRPTKFIFNNGVFVSNETCVGSGSKHIADLVACLYKKYIPLYAKGDLLDLGCGTVPFYELYRDHVKNTTCVDWESCFHDTSFVDFSVDLNQNLNIEGRSFDTVLLSDVLEHIYEPKQLLSQIYNILREDGTLILNVPFAYWEHEAPHDYYRYTRYFFQKISCDLNFELTVVEQVGSDVFDVLIDITSKLSKTYPHKFIYKILLKIIKILHRLKYPSFTNLPLGYFVVMTKR